MNLLFILSRRNVVKQQFPNIIYLDAVERF